MAASGVANSSSFHGSCTPSDREIRLTRLFDAPRALVFEALTRPEHVKEWWGRLGDGYSVPECEIDLEAGRPVALRQSHAEGHPSSCSPASTARSIRRSVSCSRKSTRKALARLRTLTMSRRS